MQGVRIADNRSMTLPMPAARAIATPTLPKAVLVGTPQTLPALIAQLGAVGSLGSVVGVIVTGPASAGGNLAGLPVLGGLSELGSIANERGIEIAVVSLPIAEVALSARVSAAISASGLGERCVPPLCDLLNTDPAAAATTHMDPGSVPSLVRPRLDLSTLIGREPYTLDAEVVRPMVQGRRILITGAGGSIGSELARIAAGFDPALLVVMDRSENAVFEIDRQLRERHPNLKIRAALHDVTEDEGTHELLDQLRPDVVFHAAAHKHVPLMEDHPYQAVRNNLFGTKAVADAAAAVGAERFVLISTDKAVRPSSVMGATKRLAELYVQHLHESLRKNHQRTSPMMCSMVRFGNVLGSAASVLQIWSAQLADGGPITVTDPRMTRYFMTIHEAATLVVQAAAMAQPTSQTAAVNVLDMGEPVRILDLAKRFVHAHGFEPVTIGPSLTEQPSAASIRDNRPVVEIVCTGPRPGEKLHEELAYAAEHLAPTSHPGIRAWRSQGGHILDSGLEANPVDVPSMIAELASLGPRPTRGRAVETLGVFVPELLGESKAAG